MGLGLRLFIFLYIFRLICCLLIGSYIDPDEFWQALEPAHWLVFGYGQLTWEWRRGAAIRTWLVPLLYAVPYRLLAWLRLDNSYRLFAMSPCFVNALIAATSDYYTILLSAKHFGFDVSEEVFAVTLLSWFNAVYGCKSYSNSIEMALFAMALFYWPYPRFSNNSLMVSLLIAGLACLIRPSAALNYLVPSLILFLSVLNKTVLILISALFGVLVAVFGLILDSKFYGAMTFSWLNFGRLNWYQNVAAFYGVSPWYYYPVLVIPTISLTMLPLVIHGSTKSRYLLMILLGVVFFNSLLGHKEIRFLAPAAPLLTIFAGRSLFEIQGRKTLFLSLIFITNAVMFVLFGVLFQRASIQVMGQIRSLRPESVYFAMPCHSTPLHSHLHLPFTKIRFISCEPPLSKEDLLLLDETKQFLQNPRQFIKSAAVTEDLVVTYAYLFEEMGLEGYVEIGKFWNGPITTDENRRGYIVLLRKRNEIAAEPKKLDQEGLEIGRTFPSHNAKEQTQSKDTQDLANPITNSEKDQESFKAHDTVTDISNSELEIQKASPKDQDFQGAASNVVKQDAQSFDSRPQTSNTNTEHAQTTKVMQQTPSETTSNMEQTQALVKESFDRTSSEASKEKTLFDQTSSGQTKETTLNQTSSGQTKEITLDQTSSGQTKDTTFGQTSSGQINETALNQTSKHSESELSEPKVILKLEQTENDVLEQTENAELEHAEKSVLEQTENFELKSISSLKDNNFESEQSEKKIKPVVSEAFNDKRPGFKEESRFSDSETSITEGLEDSYTRDFL